MKKRSRRVQQKLLAARENAAPRHPVAAPVGHEQTRTQVEATSVAQAKSAWYFGDWDALATIDVAALHQHPERGVLALLAGAANQQIGRHDAARAGVRMALQWGCAPRLVAQILTAGVHNTLGRAAALQQDQARARQHFSGAVAAGGEGNLATIGQVRAIREMTRIGLLPQAADVLHEELAAARDNALRPEQVRARVDMLETELGLLSHELSLAQQRMQLLRGDGGEGRPVESAADWRVRLEKRSVSQLGQDLWVLEQTRYKREGYFVEFGATDGVLLSNTFLLEKEFGWRGICAEPNPAFLSSLRKNRSCIVSDACVAGATGEEVEFILADAFGGMAKYADSDAHGDKRAAYARAGRVATLQTVSLHDLLLRHQAPQDIDYLSLDTEGSELEILAAFPFDVWNIRLITVEHNFTPQREQIHALLSAHGYRCEPREWDDWYVRGTAVAQ